MRRIPLYQVDAFADRPFAGNPAAVCPLDAWLPDATMQAIAAENNLSETAFLVPRPGEEGEYDLRWFTPKNEVDLCGHATLGSGWVVMEKLAPGLRSVGFHTRSGRLSVEREGDLLVLDIPSQPPASEDPPPGLVDAVGGSPSEVLRGGGYRVLVYAGEGDVAALAPDMRALAGLRIEAIATAPGAGASAGGPDFVSRMFAPAMGIPEDPVTGSAHGVLTPFWAARLGRDALRARQISERGGELHCELRRERVRLKGDVVLVLEGELLL